MVVAGFSAEGSHRKILYLNHINTALRRLRNTKWNPKNKDSYGKINVFEEKGHM